MGQSSSVTSVTTTRGANSLEEKLNHLRNHASDTLVTHGLLQEITSIINKNANGERDRFCDVLLQASSQAAHHHHQHRLPTTTPGSLLLDMVQRGHVHCTVTKTASPVSSSSSSASATTASMDIRVADRPIEEDDNGRSSLLLHSSIVLQQGASTPHNAPAAAMTTTATLRMGQWLEGDDATVPIFALQKEDKKEEMETKGKQTENPFSDAVKRRLATALALCPKAFLALEAEVSTAVAPPGEGQNVKDMLIALLEQGCVRHRGAAMKGASSSSSNDRYELKPEWYAYVDIEKFPRVADRHVVAERAVTACKALPVATRARILTPLARYIDRDVITGGTFFAGADHASLIFETTSPQQSEGEGGPTVPSSAAAHRENNRSSGDPSYSPSSAAPYDQRVEKREHLNVQWARGDLLDPPLSFSEAATTLLTSREQMRQRCAPSPSSLSVSGSGSSSSVVAGASSQSVGHLMDHPYRDWDAVQRDAALVQKQLMTEYRSVRRRLAQFEQVVADSEGLLAAGSSTAALIAGQDRDEANETVQHTTDATRSSPQQHLVDGDGSRALKRIRKEVEDWVSERRVVQQRLEPWVGRLSCEVQSSMADMESAKTVLALQAFVGVKGQPTQR